ncbi:FGGY family carbohydrate kinase [Microbacterium sp.]|uniref:FGGY family carbohydrate kinase n=1 Tax=Microbacterium sp. TaxID=51671 RepID=UPI0028112576|nr:FGGY family carbohydrate kinase [Microbacterium sp.]
MLGVDIGSTTTKAALVAVRDAVSVLRVARRPTPADVPALLDTVAALVRESTADAVEPIAAIGIASMAESGAALGADGAPLTDLLRWDRPVDPAHLDALLDAHPSLPASTGVPATTKPAAVALTALRAENPGAFAGMRHWAGVADLVAHALTGERATDHTLAARTMLAGRDGASWDADLARSLGIDLAVLPPLRAPGEPVGTTRAGAFGMDAGIPVFVAGHDHAVGAWAVGARHPGDAADSLGTAEAIVRITGTVDVARAVADGFSVGRTVDGSARTILGGSRACGAMLSWWEAEHPGDRAIERLAAMPADRWISSPLVVLPYPAGRQCPRPDAGARVHLNGTADDADTRARAVLQSLVAHARWMRESADTLAGAPSTHLTVLGSLAERIPSWAPLIAASGVSASLCSISEPVAAGAALLAGVRAEVIPADIVLPRAAVTPAGDAGFEDIHRRFLAAVSAEGEQ